MRDLLFGRSLSQESHNTLPTQSATCTISENKCWHSSQILTQILTGKSLMRHAFYVSNSELIIRLDVRNYTKQPQQWGRDTDRVQFRNPAQPRQAAVCRWLSGLNPGGENEKGGSEVFSIVEAHPVPEAPARICAETCQGCNRQRFGYWFVPTWAAYRGKHIFRIGNRKRIAHASAAQQKRGVIK